MLPLLRVWAGRRRSLVLLARGWPLALGLRVRLRQVVIAVAGGAGCVAAGDVVIFTAAGGGLSAALAAAVDSSKLPDDMAELVNAFEMSPNSVAVRTDNVAGPVSVKADARTSALASAGASSKVTTATAPSRHSGHW